MLDIVARQALAMRELADACLGLVAELQAHQQGTAPLAAHVPNGPPIPGAPVPPLGHVFLGERPATFGGKTKMLGLEDVAELTKDR